MKDRISKAWQLRHDLHAYLTTNKNASIIQIFAAFPAICGETIRKSLRRLRDDGDVMMTSNTGRVGHFRAVTETIRPEGETRAKLAVTDKFTRAYETRSGILKLFTDSVMKLNTRQTANALNIRIDHAQRTMSALAEEGCLVKHGTGPSKFFTCTGLPTQTAEDMRRNVVERTKSTIKLIKDVAQANKSKLGHYIHHPTSPLKNQEGIGSGRARVWAGSTCGLV